MTDSRTLAVFGATGKTGRHVLSQALDSGWTVRALARRPDALEPHERLTIIAGDVLDAGAVGSVVDGSDAVVSVFGQVKGSPPTLQTDGTRTIVTAMQARGIRRIVSLSGGGLPFAKDRPKTPDRVIRWLLRRLSPHVLDDALGHAEVLAASGLDWTIVRGPVLTDQPRTGRYRVGWVGVDASAKIGRADLATEILAQVDATTHVRSMPFVSY
jgi:uncharacterized protein YbjT (DUF2867 family)